MKLLYLRRIFIMIKNLAFSHSYYIDKVDQYVVIVTYMIDIARYNYLYINIYIIYNFKHT